MSSQEPVVNLTPSCGLRGKVIDADKQIKTVYSFLGVPYAEPPVGKLRFADPHPVQLWNGIRDTTNFGAICPQNFILLNLLPFPLPKPELISEDCLSLNIWTPSLDSTSRLPVMFWIHGGGFNSGFSNLHSGERLAATKNVVVVIINYRVGPLGFLCTNDSAASGNYGILDQIEALKWVQQHIVQFGGDPENVTIFGQSSGGMSVSLLVISPLAKGLFKRAIAESGNVFGGDVIACPPEKAAKNLRTNLMKKFPDRLSPTATGEEIVEFLRQQPTDTLVEISDDFFAVVDGRVLPASPQQMYSSADHNHVDLLLGCCSDEGVMIFAGAMHKFGLTPDHLNVQKARFIISNFMMAFFTVPGTEQITDAVLHEYLNDLDPSSSPDDVHSVLAEFLGDVLFLIPTIKTADNHSRSSKTFLYYFCHRPSFAWCPQWAKADHGSEVFFILDSPNYGPKLSDEDQQLSDQMISYWVNFAKKGNPNGEGLTVWPEYNESSKEYLSIQLPIRAESKLKQQRVDFWMRQLPELLKAKQA